MIVAGALAIILVVSISTETFLSSDGFESRKQTFGCLVGYLEGKNVTDESFGVAESLNLSSVDCTAIVQQQNKSFHDDLRIRLNCPIYNVSSARCDKLNNPICTDLKRLTDKSNEICYIDELTGMLDLSSKTNQERLLAISNLSRTSCKKLSACTSCVIEKLAAKDYDDVRFHSTAVNLTVIEFKIWKYFSISPRVKELVDVGEQMEKASIHQCVDENKCLKCAEMLFE